ncbi:MAG: hypothetical protein K6A41_03910 [Bacteroidales bacterium]|nr:hypothetical protein [Bacteroidales bacterium]
MKVYSREISPWLIWLSLLAVLLLCVGIFFFYTFLRQGASELIDVVPNDAAFLIEINEHEDFEKDCAKMQPIFSEILVMDAYPAFEDVYHNLPKGNYTATLSAHPGKESIHLLYNVQIDKASFRKLLKKLNLDPNNNIIFEKHKIYTFGTSYKSLKFVYFNHVLSISDDLEVLKKAIVQHRHPKNLLSDKEFKTLYTVSQKNQKQSWIIFNNKAYLTYLNKYFNPEGLNSLRKLESLSTWSAFQLRTTESELFLSGYIPCELKEPTTPKYELPESVMPQHVIRYAKSEGTDYAATYMLVHAEGENYPFLILTEDTIHPVLNKLTVEKFDSLKINHPDGIYPADSIFNNLEKVFQPMFVTIKQPTWKYCIVRDYQYILAAEKEDLQYLSRNYINESAFKNNQYYKFCKSCLPSKNVEEYTIINEDKGHLLEDLLSSQGDDTHFGKQLRAFSIYSTESTPNQVNGTNLRGVNLYFLFER